MCVCVVILNITYNFRELNNIPVINVSELLRLDCFFLIIIDIEFLQRMLGKNYVNEY